MHCQFSAAKTAACTIVIYVLPSVAAVPFNFGIYMDAATILTANLNTPITGTDRIHVQDAPRHCAGVIQ
jgi:hypothetical protein